MNLVRKHIKRDTVKIQYLNSANAVFLVVSLVILPGNRIMYMECKITPPAGRITTVSQTYMYSKTCLEGTLQCGLKGHFAKSYLTLTYIEFIPPMKGHLSFMDNC